MTSDEVLEIIKSALVATLPDLDQEITLATDLREEDILDSLDLMNFLFELENALGGQVEKIDETYDDYKVQSLVDIIIEAKG